MLTILGRSHWLRFTCQWLERRFPSRYNGASARSHNERWFGIFQVSHRQPSAFCLRLERRRHSPWHNRCLRSLAHSNLEQCQDTGSRFLGQCQHTDWIGLCWAMLDRPVGTYGDNVQWAASGGHPSDRVKAPPLAQSTMSFGFAGPQAHEIAKEAGRDY